MTKIHPLALANEGEHRESSKDMPAVNSPQKDFAFKTEVATS